MDIHHKPIALRMEWLMEHARRYAASFSSPEATIARQRYMAEHPSAIAALKCMDGRINLSVDTHTPSGIIQPFRNLGGMFDLGWPHFGEVLALRAQRGQPRAEGFDDARPLLRSFI